MCSSPIFPPSAIVEISQGSPKIWSPWRCEIKIWLIFSVFIPNLRSCIWVPSPQSTKYNRSLRLTTWEVGNRVNVGSAELLPKIVTEKGSMAIVLSNLHEKLRFCNIRIKYLKRKPGCWGRVFIFIRVETIYWWVFSLPLQGSTQSQGLNRALRVLSFFRHLLKDYRW